MKYENLEKIILLIDQLEQRKKRRQKRAREERKREKKIAEVELRQMGRHSTPRLRIDSFHHFPQCGISEDEIPPLAPKYVIPTYWEKTIIN